MVDNRVGNWAFIIGVVLAILAAFVVIPQLALILVILGLVVGFINVTGKETTAFLVATIALLTAGTAGIAIVPAVGGYVDTVLKNVVAFVGPAALVVALKEVYALASKA